MSNDYCKGTYFFLNLCGKIIHAKDFCEKKRSRCSRTRQILVAVVMIMASECSLSVLSIWMLGGGALSLAKYQSIVASSPQYFNEIKEQLLHFLQIHHIFHDSEHFAS